MMYDCVIVGGGPAGLTASIYLARFHLKILVIDAGKSRALWIARTHNHAGFPGGISGAELLERMREQATSFEVSFVQGNVTRAERTYNGFSLEYGSGEVLTKTVLLATGVQNRRPQIDEDLHERGLRSGHIRYCAVCDGYEVTDKAVAVIGTGSAGLGEALFLRSYTKDVTLISSDGSHELTQEQRSEAASKGINVIEGPSGIVGIEDNMISVSTTGQTHSFESVYPALGSDINNTLAAMLDADISDQGCLLVDDHQRTSTAGLYAAGDLVQGLNQISHAMGEGGVAATTIRNDLAAISPLLR